MIQSQQIVYSYFSKNNIPPFYDLLNNHFYLTDFRAVVYVFDCVYVLDVLVIVIIISIVTIYSNNNNNNGHSI